MPTKVERRTVDLSQFPELVVIYLGMRVNRITGLKTLFGFGPKISGSVAAQPDGLLLHEYMMFSLFPAHLGMRQYWRDMDSLLAWSRSEPHREWWKNFSARLRRHRLLARDLSSPRRNRSHLRRPGAADRHDEIRAHVNRARGDVWRGSSRRQGRKRRRSG